MRKRLLLSCIAIIVCQSLMASDFTVKNYLGINCISYTLNNTESFYQVAKKFNVRPSTLAVVNEVSDPESIISGQSLYIPLTETNFYQLRGVSASQFGF